MGERRVGRNPYTRMGIMRRARGRYAEHLGKVVEHLLSRSTFAKLAQCEWSFSVTNDVRSSFQS